MNLIIKSYLLKNVTSCLLIVEQGNIKNKNTQVKKIIFLKLMVIVEEKFKWNTIWLLMKLDITTISNFFKNLLIDDFKTAKKIIIIFHKPILFFCVNHKMQSFTFLIYQLEQKFCWIRSA